MKQEKNYRNQPLKTLIFGLVPLLLLGLVVYSFLSGGPTKIFQSDVPPVEDIHVLRHTLNNDVIILDIVNSGTDPVTIAQVMVRGAFWYHEVTPTRQFNPLKTARVIIPFPWNVGELVDITLLTSSGITFDYEIEIASNTPRPTLKAFGKFAMIGIYVGVIPVLLGICWFPFLRRLNKQSLDFLIYFTIGLLAFLALESVVEGIEIAKRLPKGFHGVSLLVLGLIGAYLILFGIDKRSMEKHRQNSNGIFVAWLIAIGIGLHNFGEGLAIGSAYVLGEITLGAMLVVGFTIHNFTEGLAIVAPILKDRVKLSNLAKLGILAGVPTIFGCWIGAFTYSQIWSILFLGFGAGALFQVIVMILRRRTLLEGLKPLNIAAVMIGYLFMYGTGLFVGGGS